MSKKLVGATALVLSVALTPAAQAYQCANTDTFASAVACADGDGTGVNDSVSNIWSIISTNGWNTTYGFTNPMTQFKDNNVLSTAIPASTTTLFDVVQSSTDASQGVLTFLQNLNGPYVLTLKGGSSWAAYVFDSNAATGNQISFDIPGLQGRGLSHTSIYTNNDPFTSPSPVPEPAAAWLMVIGLGALGLVSRRRKASR